MGTAIPEARGPASPVPGISLSAAGTRLDTPLHMTGLVQDLRYALRGLFRNSAFALVAIPTLALGIGATTAIFSVVYGVLLKPLPFDEPEQLVGVYHRGAGVNLAVMNHGPYTYFTYLDHQRVFDELAAWESDEVTISGRGEPEQVESLSVTDGLLPLLRVRPIHGRLFTRQDDTPGVPPRVVLTYGYWQRRFGGARNIVGASIEIDGTPSEVVGILPASFRFLRADPAVLLPMQLERPTNNDIMFDFQVVGRLKPGIELPQANADIARLIPLLPQTYGMLKLEPLVRPLSDDVTGGIGGVLWILMGAVGVVLLIACANVANLFLVRAEVRHQELAMRTALGASRGRIARQLVSESVLLGLASGVLGVMLAHACIALLRRTAPAELPRADDIAIDPTVLVFALAISVVTGVIFGLIPVLKFGTPVSASLKDGGRSTTDARARHRTRNTLVVSEVALAVMLLVVSGLMIRTFVAMRQVPPGFQRPEEVQTFRLAVPEEVIADDGQFARAHEQIAQRLARLPGVVSVGLSSSVTMDGEDNGNPLYTEQIQVPDGQLPPLRRFKSVGPGYFETMGNHVVAGRAIEWADVHRENRVVVISETLAREYWQEPSRAIGKRVRSGPGNAWYEVVGVSGNERDDGLENPATAIVYWPLLNDSYQPRTLAYAVRSSRLRTPGFLRELQQAVWSVNPSLPLAAVQTLDEIRALSMAQTSFAMVMLALAAGVALLLGVVGIYGVIAYVVAQRTREIGTRMALGAQAGDVRRLFLQHGVALTLTGVALGIVASLAFTRVMSALLFGVNAIDPLTYVVAAAGLTAVGALAAYLPARRASRIEPMMALRQA